VQDKEACIINSVSMTSYTEIEQQSSRSGWVRQ